MTTTTHSHKHWTDKGGYVRAFEGCHVLEGSHKRSVTQS